MPLYEFECEACEKRFERIQKFSDPNPDVCPTCGKGPVRKLPSSPAIQFKGSGFYITDYAKKSSPDSGSSSKSSSEKSSSEKSSGDSKSSDSKSGDSGSSSSSSSSSGSSSDSGSSSSSSSSSSSGDKKS